MNLTVGEKVGAASDNKPYQLFDDDIRSIIVFSLLKGMKSTKCFLGNWTIFFIHCNLCLF
jgi:hypothetical protein